MELGLIGLGKMGFNMAARLRLAGHKVVGFDFNRDATAKLTAAGSLGVDSLEDLWAAICAENHVLHKECFDILATLRSTGAYKLATLNNESRELNAYRIDAFNLRQYFDYFICSGYVHEMKPYPDIYRVAIDISGHPPQASVFIDDKPENCRAATAFGMNAIHFQSPDQLARDLAQLGIHIPTTQHR